MYVCNPAKRWEVLSLVLYKDVVLSHIPCSGPQHHDGTVLKRRCTLKTMHLIKYRLVDNGVFDCFQIIGIFFINNL